MRPSDCHGRTNTTDRTNAGTKRRRGDVTRASRFPSPKSAGAAHALEAAVGANREAETRVGRAEPTPGRTGTRARRDDRQAFALARDPGTRRIRFAKKTRT